MQTNPELSTALAFDPIAEAERQTGVSYKDDESITWLGMALMQRHNETKDALLFLNRDTTFCMDFEPFCAVAVELGFQQVYSEYFQGMDGREEFRIYWHPDGLLMTAESYGGDSRNSSSVYGNWMAHERPERCSNGWIGTIDGMNVWEFSLDGREGLRHHIAELRANGNFLAKWIKSPFLWLLNYSETEPEGYDYKAINARKIAALPAHVQQAIQP